MNQTQRQNGVPATQIMTQEAADLVAREIEAAHGAEIFVILRKKKGESLFDHAMVACRGTHVEVPALISRTSPGDLTLHNHPSGSLQPSQADMNLATLLGEEGIGSVIVDNRVTKAYVIVEPFEKKSLTPVAPEVLEEIFSKNGSLQKTLESYEFREGQLEMAKRVAESFHEGKVTSIEAGTGTGKSLGYLIPALLWTRENKKRIVIATKTITLQEQLLYKDIPIARSIVEKAPETALIKGRQNYICLRKLREAESDQMEIELGDDYKSIQGELKAISDWVEAHPSGDRAELPFQPTSEAWEAVQSDSDMCLGSSCPYFQESPFYQSRRKAAKASVLIVNQALLFTDLALRISSGNYTSSAIIPPYFSIILDEAHSLEDIATDHFGSRIGSFGLRNALSKFMSQRNNKGLIQRLHKRAIKYLIMDFAGVLEEKAVQLQSQRDETLYLLSEFGERLHDTFNPEKRKNQQVHLDHNLLGSDALGELRKQAGYLSIHLTRFTEGIRGLLNSAKEAFTRQSDEMEGFFIEFRARLSRLQDAIPLLKQFADPEQDGTVQWLTLKAWRNRRFEFQYQISPIDVSDTLAKGLFEQFHSIVCTSATLDLKDDFHFFHTRCGITKTTQKSIESYQFPSPFPLAELAGMAILSYAPEPNQRNYSETLKDTILGLASHGSGGTLVLFTSYALLYELVMLCETTLEQMGVPLYIQGRDPRSTLLDRFTKASGVLFGTDTFWEGIDLKGRLLTKLLITKLPFRQLGDPVFEARSRKIKADGGNDFKDYSLPLALLKFKQGAGRLVRSHTDEGIIVIADKRIKEKAYGKKFLSMAPDFPKIEVREPADFQRLLQDRNL